MVEAVPIGDSYGVRFQARGHGGRADTIKSGTGGDSGMRPHELLEAALATCMAISARMAADDLGVAADDIRVVVNLDRTDTASVFRFEVQLPAHVTDAQAEVINGRVESSPVRRTLEAELRFGATKRARRTRLARPAG